MTKKVLAKILIGLTIMTLLLAGCSTKPTDITTQPLYKSYEYEALKDYVHTIALVTPTDELTTKNSLIKYNSDNTISDYYSLRNVKVEKFFKNEKGFTDKLQIAERCALTKNNEYIHPEDYESMKSGHKYIVFLSDTTDKSYPIIASLNNGKVDLDNFKSNKRMDIAIKSLVEWDLDNVSKDFKEGILMSSLSKSQVDFKEIKNKRVIKSKYGDLEVTFNYSQAKDTTYIWINGYQFDAPGNIVPELSK